MKIKQVEELVGITSKNIRFYEDCGLLKPKRQDNGYREYDLDDVGVLKKIKLLRSVGIPVESVKNVIAGTLPLTDALREQQISIAKSADDLDKTSSLVRSVISSEPNIGTIDTDYWLDRIKSMEKEGTDFVNFKKQDVHVKKKAGAITGGFVMIALMLFIIGVCLWGNKSDPLPMALLIFVLAIPIAVIIGTIVVIINRVKEIDGGEEDEASKY